ncbi:hypothetical protein D5281_03330 [bacterium 1xD42-62]|uniref:Uncharacterized protein n=1 Tax=Parablautia muri TaxID=2320879 RepID=A0A9X5GQZ7_9FIRM|nr:hypothetical protein [Parablautia muri]
MKYIPLGYVYFSSINRYASCCDSVYFNFYILDSMDSFKMIPLKIQVKDTLVRYSKEGFFV